MRSQRRLVSTQTQIVELKFEMGNVGTLFPNIASLANFLNINTASITNFVITDNNIECQISENFELTDSIAFNNSIQYIKDNGGKWLGVPANTWSRTSNLHTVIAPNASSIGNTAFRECSSLVNLETPKVTFIDSTAFFRCYAMKEFNFPICTQIYNTSSGGSGAFRECAGVELINIPKCNQIGTSTAYTGTFLNIKLGCVINVDSSMATNNGGAMDGDLAYAINSRGATVNLIVN